MAVQGFSSVDELCGADANPQKVEQGVYFDGSVRAGMELFTDSAKTAKKSSGFYLLKSGNRNYKIFVTNTGSVNLLGECDDVAPGAELLFAMPSLADGNGYINNNGTPGFSPIKLAINEVGGRLKLTDTEWANFTRGDADEDRVFFLSNRNINDPGMNETPDYDVEDMRGFSMSPRKCIVKTADLRTIVRTEEQFVHIPAVSGQNRRKWTEGDVTYSMMPPQYSFDASTNVMEFDIKFPDFVLPAGNINVMQPYPNRDKVNQNMIRKGCSFVKGTTQVDKKVEFVSDDFLRAIDCPPPYNSSDPDEILFNNWLNNTSLDTIRNSFIERVYNLHKNKKYVFMNWEWVGSRWVNHRHKIDACLLYWEENPTEGVILGWLQKAFGINKLNLLNENPVELLADWKFTGDRNAFVNRAGRVAGPSFLTTAEHWDVFMVGNYVNSFYDTVFLHHLIIEAHINKKFYPNKRIISSNWFDYEPVPGSTYNNEKRYQHGNGQTWWIWSKAQLCPAVLQSYAVVSHFFMDGGDVWDEYGDGYVNDKQYWGPAGTLWPSGGPAQGCFDNNDNALSNNFKPGTGGHYPIQPLKNMDWYMAGVWAVAQLKDILDANNPIIYCDHSTDNGATWVTGDAALPCQTVLNSGIIAAYTTSASGNEAGVVVCNPFGAANTQSIIQVKVGSKIVNVKTFGRYASAVRVKNI
jgi:hypothetical protein